MTIPCDPEVEASRLHKKMPPVRKEGAGTCAVVWVTGDG